MYLNWPTIVSLGLPSVMAEIRGTVSVTGASVLSNETALFLGVNLVSNLVPACVFGLEPGGMTPAGRRCWTQYRSPAKPKLLGLLNPHSTSGARRSSGS